MNYRPRYHLSAPTGRLNDPNGLFLDGTTLHAYYQHDPCFPHAPKQTGWGHAAASVEAPEPWRHYPDALYPIRGHDAHGCYSGGAVVDGEDVWLFYTGNLKRDGERIPSQNRVRAVDASGPEGGFYEHDAANPLINGPAEGFTGHYRDPQITRDAQGWRMVLGAQREDETGHVVLYRSADLASWSFQGALTFDTSGAQPGLSPDMVPGGYMWECPNLLTLRDRATGQDKEVLVICPQGLEPVLADGTTHYASSDQCGYLVGRLEGTVFHVERGFSELDYGHQFYAPQLLERDGEALMLGWMGLPAQDDTPTVAQGWVHTLTLPRRVWLEAGELRQAPAWSLPSVPPEPAREGFGSVATLTAGEGTYALVDSSGAEAYRVTYGGGELRLASGDDERVVPCPAGDLELIADGCAVEVFAGEGRIAAASAVFGARDARWRGWEAR